MNRREMRQIFGKERIFYYLCSPKSASMITKESIETAYCFLHQKERVFRYSTMEWQKEDIEYAISSYVDSMPPELYQLISKGCHDYLLDHARFAEDMNDAIEQLEQML